MLSQPLSGKRMLCQELLRHELFTALEQRQVVIVPVGSVEQYCPHHAPDVDIDFPGHLAIRAATQLTLLPIIVVSLVTFSFAHYIKGKEGKITHSRETFIPC